MLKRIGKIIMVLSLPLQVLLLKLAADKPLWVEQLYSGWVYKHLSLWLRFAFGWLPLPLGQFLFYSLISGVLVWIGWLIKRLLKKKIGRRQFALDFGFGAIAIVSGFYFLFNAMWGLNYYRQPVQEIVKLDTKPFDKAELEAMSVRLIALTNQSRRRLTTDTLNQLQRETIPETGTENTILKPVNDLAKSLFSEDFLQTAYYAKQDRKEQNPAQISLGKMLFFDPVLSSNNQRSCASCHNPNKAFTDGEMKSIAFNENGTVTRNSPTLLNAIFATAYFWDSRAGFLEDQIPEVVKKADELHSSYKVIVQKLAQSPEYKKLFKQAFKAQAKNTLNATTVNRALSAYVRSLVSLNSPFDQYMRRKTEILSTAAIRGANLFMGKAACATCHFAPIFNSTVPPRFLESETEVLGVTTNADFAHPSLDTDPGRAAVVKAEVFNGAFKTPTVRNVKLTAPYMHNGAFKTLTEVVQFYNQGGGAGLGLKVPNQTLPADKLELTEQEKLDLIAFMESLTDSQIDNHLPAKLPSFPASNILSKRQVGGKY